MPVLDTPITTDDRSLKKVLGQKQPALVVLHDGQRDKPLEDALKKAARKHSGDLLVVRVNINENPDTHARYDHMATPALVTLTKAFFGRKLKSQQENIRPADVRAHIAHLLDDEPLPEPDSAQASDNGSSDSAKGGPVHVTDSNFRKQVLKSKTPVLVDFWAPWCGPCRSIAPYIEELSEEYAGKLRVAKLNTDENRVMAQRYQIRSIPTFIVFDGGQPVYRFSGANPARIRNMVEDALL